MPYNAALAALAANQQQQQNVLTALANRVAVGPPGPAIPPPIALDVGIKYSGSPSESLTEWLQLVNRKASLERWGDDEKRRAAIGTLYGQALTWQDEIGLHLVDWNDWVHGIRAAFETQLTESQWQMLIEARRQLPAESGSNYVLEKLKICRQRPVPLTEPQMIPYLIRGLYNPIHQSVMMGNLPATIADFLTELRRLEVISFAPTIPSSNSPSYPPPVQPSPQSDPVIRALEALTLQVSLMNKKANQATGSVFGPSAPRLPAPNTQPQYSGAEGFSGSSYGYARRPPGTMNDIQCFNCQNFGHFSRNCPQPNPRYPSSFTSGNFQAGPQGQGRP